MQNDRQPDANDKLTELVVEDVIEIGHGGQAVVYSGIWKGRSVAIKVCDRELWTEVENLQKLKHQNIVQFLGVGFLNSKFALVLEFCSGGSLGKVVRSEAQICWSQWIKWLREMADGMCYLHSQKIIHRDLKTDNVLITAENIARLADFGLSREKLLTKSSVVTTVVGTYCYMAPEMIKEETFSNKVDVWSFGVVIWETLSRRRPYDELTLEKIVFNIGSNKIQLNVSDVLPIQIYMLMARCWNREYKERPAFADIRDDIDEIEACIEEQEWTECVRKFRDECGASTYTSVLPTSCKKCMKLHPQNSPWCSLYDAVDNNDPEGVRAYLSLPFARNLLKHRRGEYTPLMKAVEGGFVEIVSELLHAGASKRVIDYRMLKAAFAHKNPSLLRVLRTHGIHLDEFLLRQARKGNSDVVALFIEMGSDCTITDQDNNALIHLASAGNHVKVVQLLLDYGVDVNMRGEKGRTSLLQAAKEGAADVAGLLLEAGADLNIEDEENNAALHLASCFNHAEVMQLLLVHDVDVNMRGHHDWTPLHCAALNGKSDLVRLLLGNGANCTMEDKDSNAPIHLACKRMHVEVVRMLLDHGVDVNMKGEKGRTPLFHAAIAGAVDVVALLLEKASDVNFKDNENNAAIHLASCFNHAAVVRLHLDHGVDVNMRGNGDCTSLHFAAYNGAVAVVRLLLENGADRRLKEAGGKTALDFAKNKNRQEIIDILS